MFVVFHIHPYEFAEFKGVFNTIEEIHKKFKFSEKDKIEQIPLKNYTVETRIVNKSGDSKQYDIIEVTPGEVMDWAMY